MSNTTDNLEVHALKELYRKGKFLATLKFVSGVQGVSPNTFEVLRVVSIVSHCEQHAHSVHTHVAFCKTDGLDYTDLFGPGIYLGEYAGKPRGVMLGHMNKETQRAFDTDPGVEKSLKCGCKLARIPDADVPKLIEGQEWVCGYKNTHQVDER